MLQKLIEFIQPSRRAPSECGACGKPFVCGASFKGCWCFDIKLSDATRRELRERYKDCLCRECLETIAQQRGKKG